MPLRRSPASRCERPSRECAVPHERSERVFEKLIGLTVQHEPRGSDIDHQFRRLHAIFVIFAEPTIPAEPGKAAFDDPRQSGDLESTLPPLHELQLPALVTQQITSKLAALVTGICDHRVNS